MDGGLFRVCWCPGGEQAGVRGSEVGKEIQQEFLDTSLAAWLWRFFLVEFFFFKHPCIHTYPMRYDSHVAVLWHYLVMVYRKSQAESSSCSTPEDFYAEVAGCFLYFFVAFSKDAKDLGSLSS